MSRIRKRTALLGAAALAAGAVVAAVAVPGAVGAAGKTTVYVPRSVCATAKAGHASCFAQKLVKKLVSSTGKIPAAAVRPHFGNGQAGGFTPNEVAKAYGFNPNAATTQTVAIVDAFKDPSVLADLNAFDAQYGLPNETATSFKVVNQTGGSDLSAVPSDVGWSGEITLDVDAVRGLCHKCKILLVETNDNHNANLGAGVNYAAAHAKIVSNSYGGPETDPENNATIKADYNHPGVAILASTGDDGWYAWDNANNGCPSPNCVNAPTDEVPSTPASYNTVVGVGGTALYVNPDGTRAQERVWNENGPGGIWGYNLGAGLGAAGSGCSTLFTPQAWQSHVAGYSSVGCGSKRSGVDVAAIADPYTGYDIYQTTTSWCTTVDGTGHTCPGSNPGWQTFGGTSLASPVIGAMWGLAGGPAGVKYPALSLYGHFKSDSSHPTYDVTVGGTGLCDTATPGFCTGGSNPNGWVAGEFFDCGWSTTNLADTTYTHEGQCYARPGYDGVAGVGTPKGLNAFKAMNPTAKISYSGTITHGVSKSFSGAGSKDPFPGGKITTYSWDFGDGSGAGSTSASISHKYASKGTRTIKLTVTDNYGRTASKSLTVTVH